MSSDLLFSILPRQGKVPMAHDEHKVQQVSKLAKMHTLSDEEQELHGEERAVHDKYQSQKEGQGQTEQENSSAMTQDKIEESVKENLDETDEETNQDKDKDKGKDKGPKHLDIYV